MEENLEKYYEENFTRIFQKYIELVPDQTMVRISEEGLKLKLERPKLGSLELNYSVSLFQDNPEEYLKEQMERHRDYQKWIHHKLNISGNETKRYENNLFSRLFSRMVISSKDMVDDIEKARIDVAHASMLREAALQGKYFFRRILQKGDEGLLNEHYKETMKRCKSVNDLNFYSSTLVGLLGNIHGVTIDLVNSRRTRLDLLNERMRLDYPAE